MSRRSRILLGTAILIHALMLVSWRTGTLNPLFFDATVTAGRRGWDFYALYQAGHNALTGHSVYESDGDQIDMVIPGGTYTPFRYLPLSAYTLGALLNLVSPLWAYRLWVACLELLLLLACALTWRVVRDVNRRAHLTAMWLCYTPFYLELYMGQFSFVQGMLIFGLLFFATQDKLHLGFDLTWVGSVLWKQNTALFLPLMVRLRRWRALWLLVTLVLLTTLPYFALHPGSLDAFLRNFSSDPPWFQLGNLGLRQLLFDTMWSAADVLGVELPPSLYIWAQRAIVGVFLLIPLALTLLDRNPRLTLWFSLWITTYFMIYHHVWEHQYVMLLPALVGLSIQHQSRWLWAIYVLLALPTPFFPIDPKGDVAVLAAMRITPIRPLWQDLTFHASKALPALALYGWLTWQIARPIVAEWKQKRIYLWPFWTSSGKPA